MMNNTYKLLLLIAVLVIAVGCENKCDEDDFIGFNITQDKFFYTTKILATEVKTVGTVESIAPNDKVNIIAFGNNLTVTPKRPLVPTENDVAIPDTKFFPAWDYELFNINNSYPSDYEIACGLELCCYSCVGIEGMFFDDTNQFKAKIDSTNINHWYVYYDERWWQWDVEKANIPWGSLATKTGE